jgi:hypothetical protein
MTEDTSSAVLRDEIARTRADLGETVEALAAKTDVKARAKAAVADVEVKARDVRDLAVGVARRPLPMVALATAAVLAGVLVYLVRRRSS